MIGNNNLSKNEFADFLRLTGFEREEGTRRQVFYMNNKSYCFSFTPEGKTPQCRQTYSDCVGFVTYVEDANKYYVANVSDITNYPYTRTMRNGVTAHSVVKRVADMTELEI